jgi:hypothetical protein
MVEYLITTHCREWKVQANNPDRATTDDRRDAEDSVSLGNLPANL